MDEMGEQEDREEEGAADEMGEGVEHTEREETDEEYYVRYIENAERNIENAEFVVIVADGGDAQFDPFDDAGSPKVLPPAPRRFNSVFRAPGVPRVQDREVHGRGMVAGQGGNVGVQGRGFDAGHDNIPGVQDRGDDNVDNVPVVGGMAGGVHGRGFVAGECWRSRQGAGSSGERERIGCWAGDGWTCSCDWWPC